MRDNLRPTPETDAAEAAFVADWNRHREAGWPSAAAVTKGFDKARIFERQRDEVRYQLATATDRAERAEARLREFCRANPSRWKRLELMDLRDQLREALEGVMEHVDACREFSPRFVVGIFLST